MINPEVKHTDDDAETFIVRFTGDDTTGERIDINIKLQKHELQGLTESANRELEGDW